MDRFCLGRSVSQRNWLPDILVRVLKTPPDVEFVRIGDAPLGILYKMCSPTFAAVEFEPLEFVVMGSGAGADASVDLYADSIFAGDVGNPATVSAAMRNAIATYFRRNDVESVGGMYPCVYLDSEGAARVGHQIKIPLGGARIELCPTANRRWTQYNYATGKELPLRFPWEIDWSQFRKSRMFNDLDDAIRMAIDGK